MNFALIGDAPDLLELARSAIRTGHVLRCVVEPGRLEGPLQQLAPHARRDAAWQELLDPQWIDVVFVAPAAGRADREDQLRGLAQAGTALVAVHPISDSMLLYFELDLIQQEAHGLLIPYLTDAWHPSIAQLAQVVADPDSAVGTVEQVVFERSMGQRTRQHVLRQFARDAYLLETVAGIPTHVSAVAGGGEDARYQRLTVQIATAAGVPIHWSVQPASGGEGGRLTLIGSSGRYSLTMPGQRRPWYLERVTEGQPVRHDYGAVDPPSMAIADLVARHTARHTARHAARHGNDLRWEQAARSVELAEAVASSVQKGRRIALSREAFSEAATFRGTMTSVGCGLLVFALLALGIGGISDALRWPIPRFWYALLLGVLVLFLLLQLLPKLVFPGETPARDHRPDRLEGGGR